MDVQIQPCLERIKEILRAEVNDPFNRGNSTTETWTSGTLTLSKKELKNVSAATGVSTGDSYYRFKDFSVSFDDPSDSTDYPEITFSPAPSENVDVKYHHGNTWIYPSFPTSSIDKAIISIKHITTSTDGRYIGQKRGSSTKGFRYRTSWQIDIWVDKNEAVDDPDPQHSGHYSGGKLADYLADQVTSALINNLDHLRQQGVLDCTLTLARDEDWTEEAQTYRKLLNFDFQHAHEW